MINIRRVSIPIITAIVWVAFIYLGGQITAFFISDPKSINYFILWGSINLLLPMILATKIKFFRPILVLNVFAWIIFALFARPLG